MKGTILSGLLVVALICAHVVSAALYKGLDPEGKVIYSDKPFDAAEKFQPPPISSVGKLDGKDEKNATDEEKAAEFRYLDFDIVTPSNNQAIRHDTEVIVSLYLKPGINTKKGHSIWLLVDGEPRIEGSQNLSLELGILDRGIHQLQAQIRDSEGEIVASTRTAVVYVIKGP